jgi:hypothetical protein
VTSHEFAQQLLAGPNLPILVPKVIEWNDSEDCAADPVVAMERGQERDSPDRIVGGSGQADEIKQMLIALASEQADDCRAVTVTRLQLVDAARRHGLLEELVGTTESGELDDTANKRFGKRMMRWRGQQLMDEKGRTFVFSHKRKKSGATYPLIFFKAPTP